MSPLKRFAVHAVLLLFAAWPLLHVALVQRFDLNPWKLAGWGMYSAPQLACDVRVYAYTPDSVGKYELRTIQPELDAELLDFLRARRGLRGLIAPDRLGRSLLDFYPAIDGVSIVVVQPVLNPRTGMIEERTTGYDYFR